MSLLNYAFPHFRFTFYLGENATTSVLAPCIDHSVLNWSSERISTHAFMTFLTDTSKGGETVLMDYLQSNNKIDAHVVRDDIQPVR